MIRLHHGYHKPNEYTRGHYSFTSRNGHRRYHFVRIGMDVWGISYKIRRTVKVK